MKRLQFLIFSVLAFILAGCGHTVIETLNVPNGPGYNGVGRGRVIVVLPFADYTYADNLDSAHRRYLKVNESLNDRLTAYGFSLPVQEDVFQSMVEQNFISLAQYDKGANSLSNELSGDWSDLMKEQIRNYIQAQQVTNSNSLAASPGTHGLSPKAIMKIGSNFQAAYIMRGRILEYKTRQEVSWLPWKKGILPVVGGGTSQMLFGFAKSDEYDTQNSMVTGEALGAWYGSTQSWPVGKSSGLFGTTTNPNTVVWGAAGGYLGDASNNSGKIDQAVVQLSVTVQEAATGRVVWSNRVQVQISPESVFADSQYDVLFNEAIEKGISSLVNNFVTYGM